MSEFKLDAYVPRKLEVSITSRCTLAYYSNVCKKRKCTALEMMPCIRATRWDKPE